MTMTAKSSQCRCVLRRANNKNFLKKRFLLAFLAAVLSTQGVTAFSPEIFNQILAQVQIPIEIQTGEVFFAAANLLDGPTGTVGKNAQNLRRLITAGTTTRRHREQEDASSGSSRSSAGTGSSIGSIIQRLPELPDLTSQKYEYETSQTRSIPSLLDLTPAEESLIQLLWNVRNAYSPSTTIRIAGGWVRDKLLYGKETPSRDVDLVLSDISGVEFAELVCRYLQEEAVRCSSSEDGSSDIIDALCNIDTPTCNKGAQSSHLQTASLSLLGFDVDFARLRNEKYNNSKSTGSRIPNVGIASAIEDAWRRDLTINSLYYNLSTNEVEDWTEQGLRDLMLQAIATPRNPLRTLIEDPLRILRAIRFAAQLSFDMSPKLMHAACDKRVKDALKEKVSRDAIGSAVDNMFGTRARDPSRGIRLLMETNLIDVVFPLGQQENVQEADAIYKAGLECLSRTQSLVTKIFLSLPNMKWDISKRRFLWYAAFLKPVYELQSTTPDDVSSSTSKRGKQNLPLYQLLDGALRRPKADMQSIESVLKGAAAINLSDMVQSAVIHEAVLGESLQQNDQSVKMSENEISNLRWKMYQTLKPIGNMWNEALILAIASSQSDSITRCYQQYNEFAILIEDKLNLKEALDNKITPILNGGQIQNILGGKINGKDFKQIVQAMEEWQIKNCCYNLDKNTPGIEVEDDQREMEKVLVDYLVATFL